ncbi:MAG: hypothetical protein ABW148_07550 [Sedimenticola sp.]
MKGFYIISSCCAALLTTTVWADEDYPPPPGPYMAAPLPAEQAYPSTPATLQPMSAPAYGYPDATDYSRAPDYPQAADRYPPPQINRRSISINPMEMENSPPSPWGNRFDNGFDSFAPYFDPRGYGHGPEYGYGYPPAGGYPPAYETYAPQGYGYVPNYGEYTPQPYPYEQSYNNYEYSTPPETGYDQTYPVAPYDAGNRRDNSYLQSPAVPQWSQQSPQQPSSSGIYGYNNPAPAPSYPAPAVITEENQSKNWRPMPQEPSMEGASMMPVGEAPVFRPLTKE